MDLKEYIVKTKQDKVSEYFITRKYLFLSKYLGEVSGSKKSALDIGSNFGLFTELLKNKGYDAYGIDVNKDKVSWAKKNAKAKYSFGTAEKIPFKKNSFDVILLLATLEHILDRGKALKEINRVLKPGGKVIITLPNTFSYFYLRSFFTYFLRGHKPWRNVHYQQNYFHWEHQINLFLKIIDYRPILSIPFFEPKLINKKRLHKFEHNKRSLSKISAEPIIICTKREKATLNNTDNTVLDGLVK